MGKQEILPPLRPGQTLPAVSTPRMHTGGPVQALVTRFQNNRDALTIDSITRKTQALTSLVQSEARAIEAEHTRRGSLAKLAEQPEVLAHELQVRRVERAEVISQARHINETNRMRRDTELTYLDITLTDARQQLEAQQRHGATKYDIEWEVLKHKQLDLDMSKREKKAMLRAKREERELPEHNAEDELFRERDRLNAAGVDTSRIDEEIESMMK